MMQFDFTQAKPLAQYMKKGTYTVKVVGAEVVVTKNGNQQLLITFENKENEKLIHYAGLDFSKQYPRDWMADFLTKLGFNVMGQRYNFTPNSVIGKACVVTVVEDWNDYNSKYYLRIKNIEPTKKGEDGKMQIIYVIDETPTPPPPARKEGNDFDFNLSTPLANSSGDTQTMSNELDPALNISDDDLPF